MEAAIVDGASCSGLAERRIPCVFGVAAFATLMFTWIYNDFFWALV